LYECVGYRENIKCRTCGRIGHSIRFCKFNECRVCKKEEGHTEPDCPTKVKTASVIEKFIGEKRNNKEIHHNSNRLFYKMG